MSLQLPSCIGNADGLCIFCGQPSEQECRAFAHFRLNSQEPESSIATTPGILGKIKNFAVAAASHVAAGAPMASDEEIIRRHSICLGCEHLKDGACSLCGCPVSRAAGYFSKLSWADQECPAGKWGKVSPGRSDSGR